VPEPRGTIEQGDPMSEAGNAEVIAVEVRMMGENLNRRLDEQRQDFHAMRQEMASTYVQHQAYMAEQKRQDDKTEAVAADVMGLHTTMAALRMELNGHIDRRFDDLEKQLKDQREASRWSWGLIVAIGSAFLASATAIVVAVVGMR
jgi:hypothetical protein